MPRGSIGAIVELAYVCCRLAAKRRALGHTIDNDNNALRCNHIPSRSVPNKNSQDACGALLYTYIIQSNDSELKARFDNETNPVRDLLVIAPDGSMQAGRHRASFAVG